MARTFAINVPIDVAIRGGGKLDELLQRYAKGQEEVIDDIAALTGEKVVTTVKVITDVDTGKVEKRVKRTTALTEDFVKGLKKANSLQTGSLSNLRQSVNTLKQQRDAIERYTFSAQKGLFGITTQIRTQNAAWTDANAKVQAAESALRKVGGIQFGGIKLPDFGGFLSLANKATQIGAAVNTAVQAFQALNQVAQVFIQRQQQIAAITLTLESFGVSAEGTSETLAQAKRTALVYGASLAEVEKGYKRLTPVILSAGGTLDTTDAVIDSLTARTRALGLNTEQSGRYIEAFAQVLGKGRLQSEELNQQFSELDGALRGQLQSFVAAKYGITDFEDALKNGQITADIFTEFMIQAGAAAQDKLAGPLGVIQGRLSELDPRQLENIGNTLNTISVEAIGNTLSGLGKQLAGIILTFQQFFAAIATNMPGIQRFFSVLANEIGAVLSVAIKTAAIGFQVILIAIDVVLQRFFELRDAIRELPVISQAVAFFGGLWQKAEQDINKTVDALGTINEETLKTRTSTSEYTKNVGELYDKYQAGKITVDQLREGVKKLREAEAFETRKQQAEQLSRVLEGQKTAVQGRINKLDEEINKAQAAFDRRKRALEEEIRLIDGPFRARIKALDDEQRKIDVVKAAILEKYALEKGQVSALQLQSKSAALQVEKDELAKLEAKGRYIDLSTEEGRALDAEIKAKRASIAQNELDLQIAEDMYEVKQKEEELNTKRTKAEADRAVALEDQQGALEDLEEEQKGVIGKLEEEKLKYEEILTEIDTTIEATDKLKTATGKVNDELTKIKDNIASFEQIKVNITAANARALGGPVKGGSMYQVNELGREAFLSSTGRLSMINKPAYGMWRAPSSGVVLPANVTEQIVQAQAMYSVSPQSRASNLVRTASSAHDNAQYVQLARSQASMAVELGKLTQAVDKINRKEWVVDLNIAPGNPLLNRLKRT